jgi:Ser-tRNA(Ala) deacylase AlaX
MAALLYLENAYLKEMEATIIEVAKESDGQQRWLLVLDKTMTNGCFEKEPSLKVYTIF